MVGDGVGAQHQQQDEGQLHIGARLHLPGGGVDDAGGDDADGAQSGDAGGGLEPAEHVGHAQDAQHADQGEEHPQNQQDTDDAIRDHVTASSPDSGPRTPC